MELGWLIRIGAIKEIKKDGGVIFRRREVILMSPTMDLYKIEFRNDKCDLLDDYSLYQYVDISYKIECKPHRQKDDVKFFTTLVAKHIIVPSQRVIGGKTYPQPILPEGFTFDKIIDDKINKNITNL